MSDKSQVSNHLKLESGSGPVSIVSPPVSTLSASVIANPGNISMFSGGATATIKPLTQQVVISAAAPVPMVHPSTQNFSSSTSYRVPLQDDSVKTSILLKPAIPSSNQTAISLANVAVMKQFPPVNTLMTTLEQNRTGGKMAASKNQNNAISSVASSSTSITNVTFNTIQSNTIIKSKAQQPILVTSNIRPLRQPSTYSQTIPINSTQPGIKANFVHAAPYKLAQSGLRGTSTTADNPITIVTRPLNQQVKKMTPNIRPQLMVRPMVTNVRQISYQHDGLRRPNNTIVHQPKTTISIMPSQSSNVVTDNTRNLKMTPAAGDKSAKILVTQPVSTTSITVPNMLLPVVSVISSSTLIASQSSVITSTIGSSTIGHQQSKLPTHPTLAHGSILPVSVSTTATTLRTIKSSDARKPTIPRSLSTTNGGGMPAQTMITNINSSSQRLNTAQSNSLWSPHLIGNQPQSRVQNNVLIIDQPPSRQQQTVNPSSDVNQSRSSSTHSPHPSPKPAILRRQRPDTANNAFKKKINFESPSTKKLDSRMLSSTGHAQTNQNMKRPANHEVSVIHSSAKSALTNDLKNKGLHVKSAITCNGLTHATMKLTAKTTKIISQTTTADGKTSHLNTFQTTRDIKVKTEHPLPGDAKTMDKNASASQILQNQQYGNYHSNLIMQGAGTQMSGYHVKTNTILANPNPRSQYNPTHKPFKPQPHIITPSASIAQGSLNASTNGFNHTSRLQFRTEFPNKKRTISTEHSKECRTSEFDHTHQNHRISAIRRPLENDLDNSVPPGLSPRKRPRKQTHIIAQDPPDVEMIEDDFSTDEADECQDEPQIISARQQLLESKKATAATSAANLPGNQSTLATSSPIAKKAVIKTEAGSIPLAFNAVKPPSEYIDADGVRYVQERKRLTITMFSQLKYNWKSTANHYLSYSDIKVKEKKCSFADLKNSKTAGLKIGHIVRQFIDMSKCENDILQRLEKISEGLENHRLSLVENIDEEADASDILNALVSPSPGGTPTQKKCTTPNTLNSFALVSSMNTQSKPATPITSRQRKMNRVKDEILKTKEMIQANIQRCKYVSEHETENKNQLLKSLKHREIVDDILNNQTSDVNLVSKRTSKKKYNN